MFPTPHHVEDGFTVVIKSIHLIGLVLWELVMQESRLELTSRAPQIQSIKFVLVSGAAASSL